MDFIFLFEIIFFQVSIKYNVGNNKEQETCLIKRNRKLPGGLCADRYLYIISLYLESKKFQNADVIAGGLLKCPSKADSWGVVSPKPKIKASCSKHERQPYQQLNTNHPDALECLLFLRRPISTLTRFLLK